MPCASWITWSLVVVALAIVTILISTTLASILSFLILLAIPLLALRYGLRFGLTGINYGLRWAVAASDALVAFRRNGHYDLLCLTPPGPLGVNWAVCTGVFYRLLEAGTYRPQDLWAGRMYLILPLTVLLTAALRPGRSTAGAAGLHPAQFRAGDRLVPHGRHAVDHPGRPDRHVDAHLQPQSLGSPHRRVEPLRTDSGPQLWYRC